MFKFKPTPKPGQGEMYFLGSSGLPNWTATHLGSNKLACYQKESALPSSCHSMIKPPSGKGERIEEFEVLNFKEVHTFSPSKLLPKQNESLDFTNE